MRGQLSVDHVTFTYPGQKRPALQDVTVRIEPGQLVALVGPSGAGKSTLTSLVARFYDPTTDDFASTSTTCAPSPSPR